MAVLWTDTWSYNTTSRHATHFSARIQTSWEMHQCGNKSYNIPCWSFYIKQVFIKNALVPRELRNLSSECLWALEEPMSSHRWGSWLVSTIPWLGLLCSPSFHPPCLDRLGLKAAVVLFHQCWPLMTFVFRAWTTF